MRSDAMTDRESNNKKMNSFFIGFLGIFFSIYVAVNYYVGLHFFRSVQSLIEPYSLFYWGGYTLLAMSLFVARLGKRFFPGHVNDWVAITGDYWLGVIYYSFLIWVVADILRFIIDLIYPARITGYPSFYWGFVVLSLVAILLIYGTWNARHPRVVHYDIDTKKTVHDLPNLHAVMVSDIHLGLVVDNDRLNAMVNSINELNPDVVFLAGDTIDEDVRLFFNQKIPEIIGKLRSKYGVYAVLGNHEYIGGNSKLAVEYLRQAGVNVLIDEYIKVNNQFYVVGRDDRMMGNMTGKQRLELSRVMDGIDHALPIILLDHQPHNLAEGQRNGVDLQLSGHTHDGQFFPNNLLAKRIFENSWGYLRKGEYQIIVSSGYGTWGPPIRIGNYSEIIDLTISFSK
jgi:predicted MPP superfamily phosphohydrolase